MKTFIIGAKENGKSNIAMSLATQCKKDGDQSLEKGEKPYRIFYLMATGTTSTISKQVLINDLRDRSNRYMNIVSMDNGLFKAMSGISSRDIVIFDDVCTLLHSELSKVDNKKQCIDNITREIETLFNITDNLYIISDYIFGDNLNNSFYSNEFKKVLGNMHIYISKMCHFTLES